MCHQKSSIAFVSLCIPCIIVKLLHIFHITVLLPQWFRTRVICQDLSTDFGQGKIRRAVAGCERNRKVFRQALLRSKSLWLNALLCSRYLEIGYIYLWVLTGSELYRDKLMKGLFMMLSACWILGGSTCRLTWLKGSVTTQLVLGYWRSPSEIFWTQSLSSLEKCWQHIKRIQHIKQEVS